MLLAQRAVSSVFTASKAALARRALVTLSTPLCSPPEASFARPAPVELEWRPKISTGIVGLDVVHNPRELLMRLYTEIMEELNHKIPKFSEYYDQMSRTIKYRMEVVRLNDNVGEIERIIRCGQIEELIEEAQDELILLPKMAEWKPWEGPDPRTIPGWSQEAADLQFEINKSFRTAEQYVPTMRVRADLGLKLSAEEAEMLHRFENQYRYTPKYTHNVGDFTKEELATYQDTHQDAIVRRVSEELVESDPSHSVDETFKDMTKFVNEIKSLRDAGNEAALDQIEKLFRRIESLEDANDEEGLRALGEELRARAEAQGAVVPKPQ